MAKNIIISELEEIVLLESQKNSSNAYVRNVLKEYLQVYVLNFIYTDKKYKDNFIFTGGTCLKHCFGLNRLSEDIDFDLLDRADLNELKDDLLIYFSKKYFYKDISASVKQKGRQLLLKFPVLKKLKLASMSESDFLYIKLDISKNYSKYFETQTTLKSLYGFNYMVKHYDLDSLMSGKIAAVLTRERLLGVDDRETIKGRDYFDLMWFLDRKVVPNLKRLNELIEESMDFKQLVDKLNKKVDLATGKLKTDFKRDLMPFVSNNAIVDGYVESYKINYSQKIKYLIDFLRKMA